MQTVILLAGGNSKSINSGIRYTKDLGCEWVSLNDIAIVPKSLKSLYKFFDGALSLGDDESLQTKTKLGQSLKISPHNATCKGKPILTYLIEFKFSKTTVPRDHLTSACLKIKELLNESKSKKVR